MLLALGVAVSSCGDSVSPERPATGLWTYQMTVASGDTTCALTDALLVLDDTASRMETWGLLDGVLDCALPGSGLHGPHPWVFYVDGTADGAGVALTAWIHVLALEHAGSYRGNDMSGAVVADLADMEGNEAHMTGVWSARRDTESETLLAALQGSWEATEYRQGGDSTNLVTEGWTYQLTFTGRHVQTRIEDPDGLLSANGTSFVVREGVIWYQSRARPTSAFRATFESPDQLTLVRDASIWPLGAPTIYLRLPRMAG
jgi:hypothetical protein